MENTRNSHLPAIDNDVPTSGTCYVVELEHEKQMYWLANWEGNPGRTMMIENAKKFKYSTDAELALATAVTENKYRKLVGKVVKYNYR